MVFDELHGRHIPNGAVRRSSLSSYSLRQASMIYWASASEANLCTFKHSFRRRPLNDSMKQRFAPQNREHGIELPLRGSMNKPMIVLGDAIRGAMCCAYMG